MGTFVGLDLGREEAHAAPSPATGTRDNRKRGRARGGGRVHGHKGAGEGDQAADSQAHRGGDGVSARTVTYAYYTGTYHGTAVAEGEWDHAALLASAHLERLKALTKVTPIGDADECESMAICAMAEVVMMWEDATTAGGGTTSETIGSVHASYGSAQDLLPGGLGSALMRAAGPWLHICLVVG